MPNVRSTARFQAVRWNGDPSPEARTKASHSAASVPSSVICMVQEHLDDAAGRFAVPQLGQATHRPFAAADLLPGVGDARAIQTDDPIGAAGPRDRTLG